MNGLRCLGEGGGREERGKKKRREGEGGRRGKRGGVGGGERIELISGNVFVRFFLSFFGVFCEVFLSG